ncbi:MAG: hypothetical protein IPI36_07180 [Chitinophagaceae bacterium]|nr:hypothetical protein [Chitinophagaceae bacterium]
MRKILFIILSASVLLYSCVSESEHEKTVAEKDAIAQERDKLKQELDDIKFGAPNLLADGKKFYEAKDFTQSKQKFQMLVDKHPDMPQSIEAKKYLSILMKRSYGTMQVLQKILQFQKAISINIQEVSTFLKLMQGEVN